jgi:hypothetical protein
MSGDQSRRNVRSIALQVRAKELDPCGEMFHVFLSYRAATEGPFTSGLYQKLQLTATSQERSSSHILVPTKWPREFLRKDPKQLPANFHTFWDKENLDLGIDWVDGFSGALSRSLVFVPILSYYSDPPDLPANSAAVKKRSGAIGQFIENRAKLTGHTGVVDYMLLQLLIAMELNELACHARSDVPKCEKRQPPCIYACMRIVPIFKGADTISDEELNFAAHHTNLEAKRILEAMHVRPSAELQSITVKAVIEFFRTCNGVVAKKLGDDLHQQQSISSSIVHCVSEIFEHYSDHKMHLQQQLLQSSEQLDLHSNLVTIECCGIAKILSLLTGMYHHARFFDATDCWYADSQVLALRRISLTGIGITSADIKELLPQLQRVTMLVEVDMSRNALSIDDVCQCFAMLASIASIAVVSFVRPSFFVMRATAAFHL